jgi:DNA-binding CsgD family transcriptional regulator
MDDAALALQMDALRPDGLGTHVGAAHDSGGQDAGVLQLGIGTAIGANVVSGVGAGLLGYRSPSGALLIRAPVIITALREYFEMLWQRATPLTAQRPAVLGERLTRAQQAVLELMAEGLHDDAIARRTGISTTTVRRHIAAITDRLDVSSRFAAGAAAQRRGWTG